MPLVIVLTVSAVTRLLSLPVILGESGGDFYNYLLMVKSFLTTGDIFIEKRLPVYALTLIPGHLIGHPLGWARGLGIIFSLLFLVILYKLLLDLRLSKTVALTSLILISWQPTFFLFSLRPLSHTLFCLEVILSIYLFYRIYYGLSVENLKKIKFSSFGTLSLFSLSLGVMSQTRHEGFLVSAVLLLSLLVFFVYRNFYGPKLAVNPFGFYSLIAIFLPFIVIVLPWFISNYFRFGSIFYTQYQTDAGLNVAMGFGKLYGNLKSMISIFWSLWSDRPLLNLVTSAFSILGAFILAKKLKWSVLPIFLIFMSQFAFLVLVQPWSRHSQHLFFLPAILLSLGLEFIISTLPILNVKKLGFILQALFLLPIFVYLVKIDNKVVASYVQSGYATLPLVRAGEFLRTELPTERVLIAEEFKDQSSDNYSLVNYYLGDRTVYDTSDSPRYALEYKEELPPRQSFTLLKRFDVSGNSAVIYEIR